MITQVQPWEYGPELEELMLSLQDMYNATDGPHLRSFTSSEVQEGGVYAGLHSDGKWYR